MSLTSILPSSIGAAIPTALWGKRFVAPAGHIADILSSGIWDGRFQHTRELDAEQLESTEAQNPLDVKGGDKPREFSITVEVNKRATGQSPISVYHEWHRDLGKSNYFLVGVQPLDSSQYILKSLGFHMEASDFDAHGQPWHATLTLGFVENAILKIVTKKIKEEKDRKGASKAAKKSAGSGTDFDLKKFISTNKL